MNDWVNFSALWQIVVVGVICGAGLPAVFAVGLWLLEHSPGVAAAGPEETSAGRGYQLGAAGTTGTVGTAGAAVGTTGTARTAGPLGVAGAGACFALVLAALGWGIYLIVSSS